MSRTVTGVLLVLGGMLSLSVPVAAHHSTNLFYNVFEDVEVEGYVDRINFVMPHVILHFHTVSDNGDTVAWAAETHQPGTMARNGWHPDMFVPGQKITVMGQPARDDRKAIHIERVILEDGTELMANDR